MYTFCIGTFTIRICVLHFSLSTMTKIMFNINITIFILKICMLNVTISIVDLNMILVIQNKFFDNAAIILVALTENYCYIKQIIL